MPPLPIATSIPAVLQAADYAIRGIRELRSRMDPQGEMTLLMNMVCGCFLCGGGSADFWGDGM